MYVCTWTQPSPRRVDELTTEAESVRMASLAREAELTALRAEKTNLAAKGEQEAARTAELQAELEKVRAALDKRSAQVEELQMEQMRLAAQVDTLELVKGHGAKGQGRRTNSSSADPNWRPPAHPQSMLRMQRHARPAGNGLPGSWPSMPNPFVGSGTSMDGETLTARSDTSTVSGGEWPEELHVW